MICSKSEVFLLPIIDYDLMMRTEDKRVVKTKKAIFRALLSLLSSTPITDITITDICRTAMINRKTFYCHYNTVFLAFLDMENLIIQGIIAELKKRQIIFSSDFQASRFIRCTHDLIQDAPEDFRTLYPYFRNGAFIRNFGIALGKEVSWYVRSKPEGKDVENFIFSYVFSITGLLVSYFDWIDSEYPVPLEHLEATVDKAFSLPLQNSLKA